MRVHSWWLAGLVTLLAPACGAPDAGTYCVHDYHCISGSCTLRSCDAFPACWPLCGDLEEEDEPAVAPPPAAPEPRPWRPLDAGVRCELKTCADLSLEACDRELACQRTRACPLDAGAGWLSSLLPSDAGACQTEEHCAPLLQGTDLPFYPQGSCPWTFGL